MERVDSVCVCMCAVHEATTYGLLLDVELIGKGIQVICPLREHLDLFFE